MHRLNTGSTYLVECDISLTIECRLRNQMKRRIRKGTKGVSGLAPEVEEVGTKPE